MEPVPRSKRVAIAIVAAVLMGGFVMMAWSILGFVIASTLRGNKSETVGLSTILIAPAGAALAALVAFGVGLIPYGPRPWIRWVLTAGAALAVGGAVFAALAASA